MLFCIYNATLKGLFLLNKGSIKPYWLQSSLFLARKTQLTIYDCFNGIREAENITKINEKQHSYTGWSAASSTTKQKHQHMSHKYSNTGKNRSKQINNGLSIEWNASNPLPNPLDLKWGVEVDKDRPSPNLSAVWMSPDMFVRGHAHTCGILSISPDAHWGNTNGDTFSVNMSNEWAAVHGSTFEWKKKEREMLNRAWQSCGHEVLSGGVV